MFTKSLESALSAMACLAEVYDGGETTLTADQIARDRQLNKPFLAKLLTSLSQEQLVVSKPGRNGGFFLARPPDQIRLAQVSAAVGHQARIQCCPFGPEYGEQHGQRCPLHDEICALRDQADAVLESSTLEGFASGQTARAKQKK